MTEKASTAGRAKEVVAETVEKTKATVGEAREKVREVSDTVRKEAAKAGGFAKEKAGVAGEALREGYGRARKDLDKLAEDVTVYVRDNPGRSVLIAGAIGFFVGFLLRSDRRR
jgi:ElaB/YqjD/DUF883 family membrane-anchored ribosome-binding protein